MEPGAADPKMALITGGGPSAAHSVRSPSYAKLVAALLETAMTHERMNDETLVIPGRFHGKLFNKAQREPQQFLGSPARNGMRAGDHQNVISRAGF